MQQPEDKKRHRKRHESWNISIRKVLAKVHPGSKIDRPSKLMMNDILNQLNQRLSKLAVKMCDHASKKTVSAGDVQTATRVALTSNLAKHAVNSAVKSVKLYTDNAAGDKEKPLSRSSRAKLVFPVSKVDRILKKNALHKNGRLGDTAPVYLASVLEYLAAELLELSGSAAANRKTTQISPRDIMFAIRNDNELNSLFKRHHILGAGVVPTHNISGGARKRVINRDTIYGVTKPAIRRILSRAGVKSMSGLIYHEIRGVIQITLENIISAAIHITKQRRAKTITYGDYKEAADILGIKTISAENHPKLCRKRSSKQAGGWDDEDNDQDDDDDQDDDHDQNGGWNDQDDDDDDDQDDDDDDDQDDDDDDDQDDDDQDDDQDDDDQDDDQDDEQDDDDENQDDDDENQDDDQDDDDENQEGGAAKKFKHRKGYRSKQNIRKHQKTNCLFIPHAAMSRLIRELSDKFSNDIRQSKTGIVFIHALIEHYMTDLAMDANLCAQHAKRTVLMPKDIQIARMIRGDRL